jgi:hypothetical protein
MAQERLDVVEFDEDLLRSAAGHEMPFDAEGPRAQSHQLAWPGRVCRDEVDAPEEEQDRLQHRGLPAAVISGENERPGPLLVTRRQVEVEAIDAAEIADREAL